MTTTWPLHGRIGGPIVMIGFGSIGKGTLPLIERHFEFDKSRFVVIDPSDKDRHLLDERGIRFVKAALTRDNYREILAPLLTAGGGQGFCVNLSVDTSSVDIMELARQNGALYIDTVERALGGLLLRRLEGAGRAHQLRAARGDARGAGAQPRRPDRRLLLRRQSRHGVVVRQAGAARSRPRPRDRGRRTAQRSEDWARLMQRVGVKGIHIAERDTQRATSEKPMQVFVNTWSVEGFVSEGMQPAELGWGTHERWLPDNAGRQGRDSLAIYLNQPGANTRVRSWCPTPGPQYGFLVTHNESISIPDFFTLREGDRVAYRPTCHYAYHPCNEAVLSLHEMFGQGGRVQERAPHPDRGRDRRRHRRARRAALRPRQERLLVRLAALDRGDAPHRALPERDRPAGDLGGARRHGLGAREPEGRHRRGGRDRLPPLPRGAAALSRAGHGRLHRLDAARRPPGLLPGGHRHVATPGSSATCWCGEASLRRRASAVAV